MYFKSNNCWRFRKILGLSQNIWTLSEIFCKNVGKKAIFNSFLTHIKSDDERISLNQLYPMTKWVSHVKKKPREFAKREKWMNKKTTKVFDLHNSCGFWHHIIYWKFSSKKIAPLMLPTPPFAVVLEHLGNDGYRNWGGELFRLHPFCSSIDCLGWCNFRVKGSRDNIVCKKLWAFG